MGIDKNKIKVLEVVSGLSQEGIGTFVLNVFENIDKNKVEVTFALATKYEQFYEQRLIDEGAKIYRTYEIGDGIKGKIKHFINLIKVIKREGPFDVVHSHMDFFNGINMLAAFIAGVRIRVSHAHINMDKSNLSNKKRLYNFVMKLMIKLFSNKRVGCSEEANYYINGTSENNIVINNGIDIDKFKNYKSKISNSNSNSNSNISIDTDINFITIGRIEEQKNPLFIVNIIRELININKNIHLYWVGVGTLGNEIKELIKEKKLEKNITLLGKRNDIPQLLSNMDYMLFPSKWEGLGIVLIEAQAAGIPCFISDTIPKEANLGLCTVLSLKNNAKYWAININNLINKKQYNNNLNKVLLSKYSIKSTIKQIYELYGV